MISTLCATCRHFWLRKGNCTGAANVCEDYNKDVNTVSDKDDAMAARDESSIVFHGDSEHVVVTSPDGRSEISIRWCAGGWIIRSGENGHLIINPVSERQINVRTQWP